MPGAIECIASSFVSERIRRMLRHTAIRMPLIPTNAEYVTALKYT
jgi:hypothetical protein